jgi:hypothetical protein
MSSTLWPEKIPYELDALKWKATGRRRREMFDMMVFSSSRLHVLLHYTMTLM